MTVLRSPPEHGHWRMPKSASAGFTLIEVLVALIILLLGLLGLIALQAKAQQAEMDSYQRTQALVLLQDMVDRINANRQDAHDLKYDAATAGGGGALVDCSGKTTIWEADLCEWGNQLNGAAEASGTKNIGGMIGARGCVNYVAGSELTDTKIKKLAGTGIYTISVVWQGLGPTVAPPASLTCGKGAYGNEALRRVVSSTLRIGALAAI